MPSPDIDSFPPLLVVGGMHRSGTSFVASLVRAAGIDLGERLLGGDATNPPGHFEDLEFLDFHQRLLAAHGLADDGFLAAPPPEPSAAFRREAHELLGRRRAAGHAWGWKDPRTVLFLPFWAALAPEARFLLVFRPAWDVIDSTYRRGDRAFARHPTLALESWLLYNRAIRDFARREPERVRVAELADVAARPADLLDGLRRRFDLPLSTDVRTFRPELLHPAEPDAAAFLAASDPACVTLLAELRELAGGEACELPLADSRSVRDHGLRAWQAARAAARERAVAEAAAAQAGEESKALSSRIAETRDRLAAAEARSAETETRRRELEEETRRRAEAMAAAERRAGELSERVAGLVASWNAERERSGQALRELEAARVERDAGLREIEGLRAAVAAADREIARLSAELRGGEARLAEFAEHLAATRALLTRSHEQLARAARETDAAAARAIDAGRRLDAATRRIGELEERVARGIAEEASLASRLDEARAESAARDVEIDRAAARAAHDAARIAELEDVVRRIRGSTIWRLAAPLRGLAHAMHGFRRRLAGDRRPAPESTAPARREHVPAEPLGSFLVRRFASPGTAFRSVRLGATALRRSGLEGLRREIARSRKAPPPAGTDGSGGALRREPTAPTAGDAGPSADPLVSVLVPVFETPPDILRRTIRSVLAQTYPRWELVLVDDGSVSPEVRSLLARTAETDARVIVHFRASNGGISAASNDALRLAGGDYIALLDHDDELEPHAIARCVETIAATGADVVYTDQDTIDPEGRIVWTFRKPAWSPEYFRHVMYVGHLLVVRRSLAVRVGGFRGEFDGVQDYEFMLRVSEAARSIEHVPEVLYHWRAIPGSLAAATDAKRDIGPRHARAVQEHLDRLGLPAEARPHPRHAHRCVTEPRLVEFPKVSIVIPSRDRPDLIGPCLASIFGRTTYPDFEVVVVDNGTADPAALGILRNHPVRIVPFPEPFNYSAANNRGADAAAGEILVFLNNDTEVITPDWLERLVLRLRMPGVGAAGPMLLYPDGSVQHAGVVLGARGTADHVYRSFPADADGYAGTLSCPREVSALSGACLAIRRAAFAAIGGFRTDYATHYQDVDLCLRLARASLRCVIVPDARLHHHESPSRGGRYDFLDRLLLVDTWRDRLAADLHYPAAFCLDRLDYSFRVAREGSVAAPA